MGLFKRIIKCDRCHSEVSYREINIYDSTFRKERNGKVLTLCRTCFEKKVFESFEKYQCMAVAVYPVEGWNAYQFYNYEMMNRFWFTQEDIDFIKSLIPPSRVKCSQCENSAHFLWSSPAIYNNKVLSGEWDHTKQFKKKFLCGRCCAEEFIKKMNELDLYFDEFFPPLEEDGFYTSWEA